MSPPGRDTRAQGPSCGRVSGGPRIDLRPGRWQDALADVAEVDAVVTDPPFSERCHAGHDAGVQVTLNPKLHESSGACERRVHAYGHWTAEDVAELVAGWADRCRGWFVAITDHVLAPAYEAALAAAGWYTFAPLPAVVHASRFRAMGDGPPCWSYWIVVARPRARGFFAWGALPGAYVERREPAMVRVGGKPLWLMRALVRDYSRPGQLVCDPCAGGGTTLLACAIEGRRAVGAEQDPEVHAAAAARLASPYTPTLLEG